MRYSSLSDYEYACIIGQYNSLKTNKSIDPRLLERGFTDEQIEAMRENMKSSGSTEIISINLKLTGPLDRFNIPTFGYFMTLFDKYHSNGVLPYPGTHSEQPAKIMEVFSILEMLKLEFEQEENERIQRENNKLRKQNG